MIESPFLFLLVVIIDQPIENVKNYKKNKKIFE